MGYPKALLSNYYFTLLKGIFKDLKLVENEKIKKKCTPLH